MLLGPIVAALVDNQEFWPALHTLYSRIWCRAIDEITDDDAEAPKSNPKPDSDANKTEDARHADNGQSASNRAHKEAESDSPSGAQAAGCEAGLRSDMAMLHGGERSCYLYLMLLLQGAGSNMNQQQGEESRVKHFCLDALSRCTDEGKWLSPSGSGSDSVSQSPDPCPPSLLWCAGAVAACSGQCDASALRKSYRAAAPATDLTKVGERVCTVVRRAAARACINASIGAGGLCACRGELLSILATEPPATYQPPILLDGFTAYRNRVFVVAHKGPRTAVIARLSVPTLDAGQDVEDHPELEFANSTACMSLAAHQQSRGLRLVVQGKREPHHTHAKDAMLGLMYDDCEAISAFIYQAQQWLTGDDFETSTRNWHLTASRMVDEDTSAAIISADLAHAYRCDHSEEKTRDFIVCALCDDQRVQF